MGDRASSHHCLPRLRSRAVWTVLILLSMADPAAAQETVAQFYRGKQINLVIGSSAGGGYDAYARLLARHLSQHIPGNPTIVPQNMSGAGSNKAAAYVYAVAPKDGTVMGAIFPGAILQPLLGEAPVQHDPSKFTYIGSANSELYICIARTDAPVKTFEDVFTHELIVGASGEGGTTRDLPALLNNVLGAKFRIVAGYAGSREISLAIERNEVQGVCGIGWTSLATLHPDWRERGVIRILSQESARGHPEINKLGVPLSIAFAKTEDDRRVMELVYSQSLFGRPFVLPPGVPADRTAAVRKAFMDALKDPALLAEAQRMRLEIDPISGEDLQQLITQIYSLPANIVQRAKQALIYRPPAH